jgi:hypothetical protein
MVVVRVLGEQTTTPFSGPAILPLLYISWSSLFSSSANASLELWRGCTQLEFAISPLVAWYAPHIENGRSSAC